jgi:hypothetical protein
VDRRPRQEVELNESTLSLCSLNEELLNSAKDDSNVLHTIKEGKVTLMVTSDVGSAFGNMLLKDREGRIEVTERRGRKREKLLDELKETRQF